MKTENQNELEIKNGKINYGNDEEPNEKPMVSIQDENVSNVYIFTNPKESQPIIDSIHIACHDNIDVKAIKINSSTRKALHGGKVKTITVSLPNGMKIEIKAFE